MCFREALAAENPSVYYPLLTELAANEKFQETDQSVYEAALAYSIVNGYISQDQVQFVDLSLGIHKHAALVQSYYQFFDSVVVPEAGDTANCRTVLAYAGKTSCDTGSVFALETKKKSSEEHVLPTDRVVGDNADAPLAVVYTDLTDPKFGLFHEHLYGSAQAGKIRYVVRYKATPGESEKQELTGFGAELYIKRTDYLVIDDRDQGKSGEEEMKADPEELPVGSKENDDEDDEDEDEDDEDTTVLKPDTEGSTISKKSLITLGFKAASYILNSESPFEALANVSLDFPKFSYALSKQSPDQQAYRELQKIGVRGGTNALYINGAKIDNLEDDIFSVAKVVDRERQLMKKFQNLGVSSKAALKLVMAEPDAQDEDDVVKRYDYRSASLLWFNDLARDKRYNSWSKKIDNFLRQSPQQLLSNVRHNAHTVVYAMDLSKPNHYTKVVDLINLIARNTPLQVGILPLISSPESETFTREALSLFVSQGGQAVMSYVIGLMEGRDHESVFANMGGDSQELHSPAVNKLVEEATETLNRLDLDKANPTLFTNGIITSLSQRWFYEISNTIRSDLPIIQSLVLDGEVIEGVELKDLLLKDSIKSRNSLISPSDKSMIVYFDINKIYESGLEVQTYTNAGQEGPATTVWVVGEPNKQFLQQLEAAIEFADQAAFKTQVNVLPFLTPKSDVESISRDLFAASDSAAKTLLVSEGNYVDQTAETLDKNLMLKNHNSLSSEISGLTVLHGGRAIALNDRVLSAEDFVKLQEIDFKERIKPVLDAAKANDVALPSGDSEVADYDKLISLTLTAKYSYDEKNPFFNSAVAPRLDTSVLKFEHNIFTFGSNSEDASLHVTALIDPLSEKGQVYVSLLKTLAKLPSVQGKIILAPLTKTEDIPLKRFYRTNYPTAPKFDESGNALRETLKFSGVPQSTLLNLDIVVPSAWVAQTYSSHHDLENIVLDKITEDSLEAGYALKHLLLEGHAVDVSLNSAPRGMALELGALNSDDVTDTSVMANLGYFQLKANPGLWQLSIKEGRSQEIFKLDTLGLLKNKLPSPNHLFITEMTGLTVYPQFSRQPGAETQDVLESADAGSLKGLFKNRWSKLTGGVAKKHADINIFTVASGHLYERFLSIMTLSVMQNTNHTVKFWLIENFLSPSFKKFLPHLATKYGFEYELVTYKWPSWLRHQTEKQRTIWGYKILFLDVLFPQSLDKVIFVDADQIVRTDMMDLNNIDLQGAPYGFTPMCDSREEIEGFRFWKQGYWQKFLGDLKYHISALYVVDLKQFRKLAAGDQLRQHYQMLSADPGSLSNLDQDLPNHLQKQLPIFSLPQDWLWCETWCSDESLETARTIDLCNNPMTKEPKLDRARRQVPEWVKYDSLVSELREAFEAEEQAELLEAENTSSGEELEGSEAPESDYEPVDLYDEL